MGKNCKLNAQEAYSPQLKSINERINTSTISSDINSRHYINWIFPIKKDTEQIRAKILKDTNVTTEFSFNNQLIALLLLTKIPEYYDAKGQYDKAEDDYSRGRFYSSKEAYGLLESKMKNWKSVTIIDYFISIILWGIIVVVIFHIFIRQIVEWEE